MGSYAKTWAAWPFAVKSAPRFEPGTHTVLGASLALLLASFLPWFTVDTVIGSVAVNGIEADGLLTLAIAIIAGVLALVAAMSGLRSHLLPSVVLAAGALTFGIGTLACFNAAGEAAAANSLARGGGAAADPGIGLYLVIFTSIVLMVGASMMLSTVQRPVAASPAPVVTKPAFVPTQQTAVTAMDGFEVPVAAVAG